MLFVPCSVDRQPNPLALAPKKSIALQSRQRPLASVAPISGGSGSSMTASSAGRMPSTVAPMPSVGWVDMGAQGAPLEAADHSVMAAIPLLMAGRMELPTVLVAPTVMGVT